MTEGLFRLRSGRIVRRSNVVGLLLLFAMEVMVHGPPVELHRNTLWTSQALNLTGSARNMKRELDDIAALITTQTTLGTSDV